jgi:hypothetical protein
VVGVVGSQTANLTPGLSFDHNLCYRCPNGSCEPILDICTSIAFQWYKEIFKARGFDLCYRPLKFRESTETPTPKMGVHLGVWMFILTLSHTPGLLSSPTFLWTLALVTSPKLGLRHFSYISLFFFSSLVLNDGFFFKSCATFQHFNTSKPKS